MDSTVRAAQDGEMRAANWLSSSGCQWTWWAHESRERNWTL